MARETINRRSRQLAIACASAVGLTLSIAPASALAGGALRPVKAIAETLTTSTQPPATITTTPPAPPASTTSTSSEAPPASTTSSAPGEAPAPSSTTGTGTTTAPTTTTGTRTRRETTPQVSGQSSQGATRGSAGSRAGSPGASKHAAAGNGQGAGKGATGAGDPRRGKPAPQPSALTPALPLSLTSSIAGVPQFFIESFRIPPFLLPIFEAAGTAYGVPWQVLAAINEVETDYGRDLSVSSAGAEGWMQFLPSSWATYGVDANGDGFKDPYNPADAIFAAARYLRAAGAASNLRGAIFAYNHSPAYVESVMLRAKLLGGTPAGLLGAVTGLTQSRFPVHARAHFSDGFPTVATGSSSGGGGDATTTIPGTTIYAEANAPVIAVQDGEIVQIGDSRELGHFISLRDAYGNTYTYAQLGSVAKLYPVLEPHDPVAGASSRQAAAPPREPKPAGPASAGAQPGAAPAPAPEEGEGLSALSLGAGSDLGTSAQPSGPGASAPSTTTTTTTTTATTTAAAGGLTPAPSTQAPSGAQPTASTQPAGTAQTAPAGSGSTPRVFRDGPNDVYLHDLRAGVQVIAGTVLGHVAASGSAPAGAAGSAAASPGEASMIFQIRPAGTGAPLIDPKPILDGWVQLENTSVFRANGRSALAANEPSAGQVLLESKEQLERQVLANPGIALPACAREEVQDGRADRRVLAVLEFLEVSSLRPTVSALTCGQGGESASAAAGRASAESVDVAAVNGVAVEGHEGPGSIAALAVRKLLALQGSMKPREVVDVAGAPGAGSSAARNGHIHVSFAAAGASAASAKGSTLGSQVTPSEWLQLIARLGEIPDPHVASGPSPAAIPDGSSEAAGAGASGGGR